MSFIGWMDYSESDRKKALDVIDLFSQPEARDELGIGTVRDAIAEALFPGTSTIQTRAKYFLFIPWVYLSLEKRQRSSKEVPKLARDLEVELISALLGDDDTQGNGVIGREARADLKRLASNVYWQGLGRWGIREFSGSQEVYHRYLNDYYRLLKRRVSKTDDGESIRGCPRLLGIKWLVIETVASGVVILVVFTVIAITKRKILVNITGKFVKRYIDLILAWLVIFVLVFVGTLFSLPSQTPAD